MIKNNQFKSIFLNENVFIKLGLLIKIKRVYNKSRKKERNAKSVKVKK